MTYTVYLYAGGKMSAPPVMVNARTWRQAIEKARSNHPERIPDAAQGFCHADHQRDFHARFDPHEQCWVKE